MGGADTVVIGGGIVGWSAALALLERDRHRRVTVVDDERPGRATQAGAGIATPFTRRDRGSDWTALMFGAMRTYADLVPRLEADGLQVGHQQVGRLVVAVTDDEAQELNEILARAHEQVSTFGSTGIGIPELVDTDAVARLHPLLAPAPGALLLPDVAQVNGRTITAAIRSRAIALGAVEVIDRAELVVTDGRIRGVAAGPAAIITESVIAAAGTWTEALVAPHGLSLGLVPQRGQVVHATIDRATPLPIASTFDETYLLTFPDGRIVFGPTREDDSGDEPDPTIGALTEMLNRSARLAPGIATARWHRLRTGLRPISRDGLPTIGRLPPIAGLVVATGLGAQGLTVGPHVGAWAAALADGSSPPVPPAFSPQRWNRSEAGTLPQ